MLGLVGRRRKEGGRKEEGRKEGREEGSVSKGEGDCGIFSLQACAGEGK